MVEAATTDVNPKPQQFGALRWLFRRPIVFYSVLGILSLGLALQFLVYSRLRIQIAFAEEQTKIFDEMAGKAVQCLEQSPPDVVSAVGYLEYLHNYYPSGTKQSIGSRLDTIVERCRDLAEMQIIDKVRDATKMDYGENAELWIEAFGNKQVIREVSKE